MDSLFSIIRDFSSFLKEHIPFISTAMIASIMIIFGKNINTWLKTKLPSNAALRWFSFVVIVVFVYGFLLQGTIHLMTLLLQQFDKNFLAPIVIFVFCLLGFCAEKNS